MLIQIVSHTPLYVWAILAFLVYRGVLAMRTREMEFRKLFIIPAVMLALSLQDILHKFGADGLALAAWALGAAVSTGVVFNASRARIGSSSSSGSGAGRVMVAGSRAPLVLMMAIFATKYATAVMLAMSPSLAQQAGFAFGVALLFGCFNGYFAGRLGRDCMAYLALTTDRTSDSGTGRAREAGVR